MMKKSLLYTLTILIGAAFPANAAEKTDTATVHSTYTFKAKDLILPGALITVGATSLFFNPMKELDKSVNKNITDLRSSHRRMKIDEYLRFAPTATNFILHFAGIKSKYDFTERVMLTATSFATMYILTQGMKHSISKKRPDGSDTHSFPSGHAATAFLGAESLRINYGSWWGIAGYTMATGTAFLRLYNNRHWLGDVIGAAGIGILSARIGYWLLPWEKRILGITEKNTSFMVMPAYNSHYAAPGIAFAMQF